MLGVYVTVPVACFRKGLAREYLESDEIPPPATCYGFLLSLIGETDRKRHCGVRVTPALIGTPEASVVLRTVWRVKNRPLGSAGNSRPDYQQLLTGVELVIWLDSSDESSDGASLEHCVAAALDRQTRTRISRFGGLSLGESTHLVDQVSIFNGETNDLGRCFIVNETGRITLPVWVDHVGSAGTNYATGDMTEMPLVPPDSTQIPQIVPRSEQNRELST